MTRAGMAAPPLPFPPLRRWRGPLLVFGAALLWSSGGLGIKFLAGDLSALAITGWRSLFALPLLFVAGGMLRGGGAVLRRPVVIGTAIAYASTLTLFVTATTLTTAANAILLQYTAPFWVLLWGLFRGEERPRRREVLLALGCFAGLGLFFVDRVSATGLRGILFAIVSGVAMGAMTVGLRAIGREGVGTTAFVAVLLGNVVCTVVCLPAMVASAPRIAPLQWGVLAGLGLFQIALPYILFSVGVREVPALRATILAMIEPLLNPLWVAIGTGEIPGIGTSVGGGIILFCLVLDALVPRRPDEPILIPAD